MSTTGWVRARSTAEQRRSASWEIASADVPWPDWPRGDLNLATLELLGREKDLTYIATLCRAGLIRLECFEQRLDATDVNTAKPETGAAMRAFRAAFAKRRCLMPADGFYEWRREGEVRQPRLIARRDGEFMAFAALRGQWRVPEGAVLRGSLAERRPGELVERSTILTTGCR